MSQHQPISHRTRNRARVTSAAALTALFLAGPLANSAHAVVQVPPLLTARNFSVLAGAAVSNTGVSTIAQDLGVSPGTSLPPTAGANALIVLGAPHSADAVAAQAKLHLTGAYNNARDQTPPFAQDDELGGETLPGGIYKHPSGMGLTGQVTLDGQNNPDSIWVFQAGSTLIIDSAASVRLIRGANPCNVFWQVSSSATLGTGSRMIGTIMADQTIAMQTGATLQGRVLARIGEVTMDHNVITNPLCQPVGLEEDDDTDEGTEGGTGSTGGDDEGDNNGDNNGDNGGTGNAAGGDEVQVARAPEGAVDTGYAGPTQASDSVPSLLVSGVTMVAFFAGLVLVAGHRRRRGLTSGA